jgi:cyclophilin family peptidyl-prolyl cis-trans isomerase
MVAIAGVYLTINNIDRDNGNDTPEENPIAVIDTSMGTIKVELYKDKAPNTVDNFVKLANDGFYEGLVFHRVTNLDANAPDTHVAQGGGFDEQGNQKESPYGTIDLEINDELSHVDGAISMARTSDPNSATSQFYICDGEHTFLDDSYRQANMGDRGYAVFGKVIDGMNVVRDIASVDTDMKVIPTGQTMFDWPKDDVIINSITIENQ